MIQSMASAFLLGLVSSLHCVGMCGPLALALPTRDLRPLRRVLAGLSYHGGRIGVYTLAGVVFGFFGRGVYVAGWQQQFSIGIGVVVVSFVLFDRLRPAGLRFLAPLQRAILRLWNAPGRGKFFVLGVANGLLPCGMVYLAIAGALTRTTVVESAGFMACFGGGTLPMLIAFHYCAPRLGFMSRAKLRRIMPMITIGIGLLLILRGLGLGLPFLSPLMAAARGRVVSCH